MRAHGILVFAFVVWLCRAGFAEELSPRKARVGDQPAIVRSGPGLQHYATEELRPGDEVEVWRRRGDGWLAIRPPKSSFSLIEGRKLRRLPGTDLGEVMGEDAVSWVGSALGDQERCGWQVRLHPGEKVIILGEERRSLRDGGPAESVYRISPPAGEFRWIHERDLQATLLPLHERTDAAVRLADYRIATAEQEKESAPQVVRRDGFVPRKSRPRQESIPVSEPSPAAGAPASEAVSHSPRPSAGGTLDELQVRLSIMASKPVSSWDVRGLREEAQRHLEAAKTTLERARAQRFLDQLEEFDGLKSRFGLLRLEDSWDADANPEGETERSASGAAGDAVDPRFDGTGWLLPVHSKRRASPPYALLDQEGRILQFVSPSPGLNLHRYLKKEVGIYGQRAYLPSLDKPHLTAHRVVELDRHRR